MVNNDRLRDVARITHETNLKKGRVLVEQSGRRRAGHHERAVEPDLDEALFRSAGPQDVNSKIVPATRRERALPRPTSRIGDAGAKDNVRAVRLEGHHLAPASAGLE